MSAKISRNMGEDNSTHPMNDEKFGQIWIIKSVPTEGIFNLAHCKLISQLVERSGSFCGYFQGICVLFITKYGPVWRKMIHKHITGNLIFSQNDDTRKASLTVTTYQFTGLLSSKTSFHAAINSFWCFSKLIDILPAQVFITTTDDTIRQDDQKTYSQTQNQMISGESLSNTLPGTRYVFLYLNEKWLPNQFAINDRWWKADHEDDVGIFIQRRDAELMVTGDDDNSMLITLIWSTMMTRVQYTNKNRERERKRRRTSREGESNKHTSERRKLDHGCLADTFTVIASSLLI